ncbi:MAG: SoxR reducing system RseC family protein [Paludibacteraceae bacterium]|nr:SoxR reducing system RseC family protein [Paludibacteraceae bacterium]
MVEHKGHIIKIEGNTVTVKVLQLSGCAHCEGKKYCTLAEAKEKEIKISVKDPSIYTVGEEVEIIAHKKQLFTAVFWAYVLPLILLFIGVGLGSILELPEIHSALMGLIAVAMYYVFLFAINKYLSKSLEFKISKLR